MLLGYLLISLAVLVGNGTIWGLPLMLAALAWLHRVLRRGGAFDNPRHIAVLVALCALSGLFRAPAFYLAEGTPRWPFALATVALGALAVAGCLRPRLATKGALACAVGLAALIGAAVILRSPAPRIDVFVLEQGGAHALLDGKNPYAISYPNPYDAVESEKYFADRRVELSDYPYPPLSLYATTLGVLVAGDVRWALLAAQLAIALLLFALARRHQYPPWYALALAVAHLSHPRGPFVLEQAWSDTLPALALVGALTTRAFWGTARGGLATIVWLALFFAAKQYSVVLLPLLLHPRAPRLRITLVALALAAAITLPFVVWDLHAFISDVVLFQLRQPFRVDSLSLPALVAWITGWQAPGVVALVAAGAAIAVGWRRIAGPRSFALVSALAYGWFFLSAKQAFCNYYYFLGVVVLAAAASRDEVLSSAGHGG